MVIFPVTGSCTSSTARLNVRPSSSALPSSAEVWTSSNGSTSMLRSRLGQTPLPCPPHSAPSPSFTRRMRCSVQPSTSLYKVTPDSNPLPPSTPSVSVTGPGTVMVDFGNRIHRGRRDTVSCWNKSWAKNQHGQRYAFSHLRATGRSDM